MYNCKSIYTFALQTKLKTMENKKDILEFDFINELNIAEREYLDQLLYDKFHDSKTESIDRKKILNIRKKINMEIQENYMISDYEVKSNERFK